MPIAKIFEFKFKIPGVSFEIKKSQEKTSEKNHTPVKRESSESDPYTPVKRESYESDPYIPVKRESYESESLDLTLNLPLGLTSSVYDLI